MIKPLAKNYQKMWLALEETLLAMAQDNYYQDLPELRLFVAIIIQAGKDRDIDYFKSSEFELHTYYLKLKEKFIKDSIKRAWQVEQSGLEWEYTSPMEGDGWAF